jgi:hypothetical protein
MFQISSRVKSTLDDEIVGEIDGSPAGIVEGNLAFRGVAGGSGG